jgi:hypothetical protein
MIYSFKHIRKKRMIKALLKDYFINTKPYEMEKDSNLDKLVEKIVFISK